MSFRKLLSLYWNASNAGSQAVFNQSVSERFFYVLKTGCQSTFLPNYYGLKSTVHEHFQRRETHWGISGTKDAAAVLAMNPNTLRSRIQKLKITGNS